MVEPGVRLLDRCRCRRLQLLAELIDLVHKGDVRPTFLASLRRWEERYGLTPTSRRYFVPEIEQRKRHSAATADRAPVALDDARWRRATGGDLRGGA